MQPTESVPKPLILIHQEVVIVAHVNNLLALKIFTNPVVIKISKTQLLPLNIGSDMHQSLSVLMLPIGHHTLQVSSLIVEKQPITQYSLLDSKETTIG